MNKIKCYINANYIDILKNNKIYHIIDKSIDNGDIINSSLFLLNIRKYKIFSNIFTYNIDIYLNHKILEKDKMYYKNIFDELNCSKVNIMDTSNKLISPTLIVSNNYYIIYYNDNYYNIDYKLLDSFLSINNIQSLKIISKDKLEINNNCKYYYYSNIDNIFFTELKKSKE